MKRRCLSKYLSISVFMVAVILPSTLLGQITFERTYGGAMEDRAFCVQQTTDGGYVLVGLTSSFGAGYEDVYVIKTDSIGDPIWTKTFGDSSFDDAAFVEQTNDGGYIVVGTAFVIADSAWRIYLVKMDSLGDSVWSCTYGNSLADFGSCVRQTKDGGYIISGGYSYSDVYLIKTDSVGDSLWSAVYGDFTPEFGYGVQETDDGGYIVVGRYFAGPRDDVYLIKTDSVGNALWTKTYGGNDRDVGYCVEQTEDGGYVLVGYTSSFGAGQEDIYLIRTDSSGDTLWTRTYGGNSLDWGYFVHQTSDGGYVICGGTWSFGPGHIDAYLVRIDSLGDTIWTRTFGGFSEDWGSCVQITDDGGYVVAGWAASFGAGGYDFYLIKTDENGLVARDVAVVSLDAPGDTVFTDSTYAVGATVQNFLPGFPCFDVIATIDSYVDTVRVVGLPPDSLMKITFNDWRVPVADSTTYTMTVCTYALGDVNKRNDCARKQIFAYNPVGIEDVDDRMSQVAQFRLLQNQPNPFHGSTIISYSLPTDGSVTLEIYDITGRLIEALVNKKQDLGIHQVRWNRKDNASGVYFYRLKVEEFVETKKMVVVE